MSAGYRGRGVYARDGREVRVLGAAVEYADRPTRSVILVSDGVWPPGGNCWFLDTSEFNAGDWRYVRDLRPGEALGL